MEIKLQHLHIHHTPHWEADQVSNFQFLQNIKMKSKSIRGDWSLKTKNKFGSTSVLFLCMFFFIAGFFFSTLFFYSKSQVLFQNYMFIMILYIIFEVYVMNLTDGSIYLQDNESTNEAWQYNLLLAGESGDDFVSSIPFQV